MKRTFCFLVFLSFLLTGCLGGGGGSGSGSSDVSNPKPVKEKCTFVFSVSSNSSSPPEGLQLEILKLNENYKLTDAELLEGDNEYFMAGETPEGLRANVVLVQQSGLVLDKPLVRVVFEASELNSQPSTDFVVNGTCYDENGLVVNCSIKQSLDCNPQ